MDQKILIIDGHSVYVNRTVGFLHGLTFKNIKIAATGKQGIDEVRANEPNLIILSAALPDMDGLEVCKTIHEITRGSIKIIVQMGLFTESSIISKFTDYGADAVLMRKERDLKPLQSAIEELLFSKA